ncbi:MAG: RHS repeat-associated core domain-containing protein [Candidatus Omnitrophota bacterium]
MLNVNLLGALNGKVTGNSLVFTQTETGTSNTANATITEKTNISCSGNITSASVLIKNASFNFSGTYTYDEISYSGAKTTYITKTANFSNTSGSLMVFSPPQTLDTIIDSGPSGDIRTQNVTFIWHGIEGEQGIAGYYYVMDSSTYYTTATSMTFKNLSLGPHNFMVFAKDNAGNLDLTPAKAQFTITQVTKSNPLDEYYYGKPADSDQTTGDPVNLVNGNMYIITTDFKLPGRSLNFEFTRSYNSLSKAAGPLGCGWTHNYNIYLTQNTPNSAVKILAEEGRAYIFVYNGDGAYLSQYGDYSTLIKNSSNFIWRKKDGKQYIFDLTGKLLKVKDRNNNTITFTYDAQKNLIKITDTAGRLINLAYNSKNLLTRITDPSGRYFNYAYDTSNNLISVTDPPGNPTTYKYDSKHNLTKKTGPKGESAYFTYDSSSRCTISSLDNNLYYRKLKFDPTNSKTVVSDSKGNQNVYYYNKDLLIAKIINPLNKTKLSAWDSNFNLTSRTDELGRVTQMEYDSFGNLTKVTDSLGNSTLFTYETTFNQIKSATDFLGRSTLYTYDAKGNLTKVVYPDGSSLSYAYNAYGLPIASTNQLGKVTNFGYDTKGNLTITRDPLKAITYFTYDSIGNLIQTQDPAKNITKFAYDSLNRLIQVTYPDGSKVKYAYDADGNCVSATDQNSNITRYAYNQDQKVISSTDELGKTITYAYDTEGNLITVTGQNNNSTTFRYDSLNRLVLKTDALGNKTRYAYDAAGNLTAKTDALGKATSYTYDSLNRLIKAAYPEGAVTYTYDAMGRRLAMADSRGKTSYTYDKLGRLLSINGPLAVDTITYTYDKAGNRLSMTDPDKKVTKYAYDADNRILAVTDPQGKITKYAYDSRGNIVTLTYPNNTKASYTYNSLNRLTKLSNARSVAPYTTINQFSYSYDLAGRRTKTTFPGGSISYSYSKRGELTKENRSSTSLSYQISYAYDAAGNRTSMVKAGKKATYAYNSLDQLTKEIDPILGQITYTYDANGNLISQLASGKTTKFTFDSRNQLTSFTSPSVKQTYKYDGEGKRVALTSGSVTTTSIYDGLSVIREANSKEATSYIRNPLAPGGIAGILKGISSKGASYDRYYHYDSLGSVTNLTNSTGVSAQAYGYDAFGNIVTQSGSSTNDNKFLTKEMDASGLIYFGARYYDPRIGRFISADPSGMSDGPNLYVYCKNDPVNAVDLWGMCGGKPWGPWWIEVLVPGWGVYGGPFRTDPTFQVQPVDSMDKTYMGHDMIWVSNKHANRILLWELGKLPLNPNNWEKKPNNIFGAILYRGLALAYFFWFSD